MKKVVCTILSILAIALVLGVVSGPRWRKIVVPTRFRTTRMPIRWRTGWDCAGH